MTFKEWIETEPLTGVTNDDYMSAWLGWMAGQKAERERIKQIIEDVYQQGTHKQWLDYAIAIVERIEE